MNAPPPGLNITVEELHDEIRVKVLGNGIGVGIPAYFSAIAIMFGLLGIACLAVAFHRSDQIGYWLASSLLAFAAISLSLAFAVNQCELNMFFKPGELLTVRRIGFLRFHRHRVKAAELRSVRIEWIGGKNKGIAIQCMRIEEIEARYHDYLHDYPFEGLEWIADLIAQYFKLQRRRFDPGGDW